MALIENLAFTNEITRLSALEIKIQFLIEECRKHLSIAEDIAEQNGRKDIAQLLSFNHHVVLNALLPVLTTVEQGNARAHLLAQREP